MPYMTSSDPRVVPHIPSEIAKKIADHLDLDSAFNLSLTCKSLRDIGECRLWSGINLCSTLSLSEDEVLPNISMEQYHSISSRFKSTVSALDSHPFRAECVSTLIVPTVVQSHLVHLDRILEMVHPRLDVLSLLLLTHNTEITENISTLSHIAQKYMSWPKLHTIRLFTSRIADIPFLLDILHQSPSVRNVEFGFNIADTIDYSPLQPSENPNMPLLPPLPSITHISLTHFGDRHLVPALLARCPNLVEFTMKGDWNYGRSSAKTIIRSLKKLEKLKSVNWLVDEDTWKIREALRRLKAVESFAEVCDATEDESFELDLETIEPITSKGLTRLVQVRGMRPSPEAFVRMGIASTPVDKRRSIRLPADFAHLLYHCPKLTEIIYLREVPDSARPTIFRPPISSPPGELEDDSALLQSKETYLPADRWEAEGMRGLTVRTYHTSSTGHYFVHVRALTRATEYKSGFYVGEKRQWHDMTRYRGRVVPYTVLREMYDKEDLDLDWKDGHRGMKLEEGAWGVLEKWFEETEPIDEDDSTDELPPGMEHNSHDAQHDDDDDDVDSEDDSGSEDLDDSADEGEFQDEFGSMDEWVDEDDDVDIDEDDDDGHLAGNGWW